MEGRKEVLGLYLSENEGAEFWMGVLTISRITLRKMTKNRASFPNDAAIYKIMDLAVNKASRKWTMSIRDWGLAISQFSIMYENIR